MQEEGHSRRAGEWGGVLLGLILSSTRLGPAFAPWRHVCNNVEGMCLFSYAAYGFRYLRQAITLSAPTLQRVRHRFLGSILASFLSLPWPVLSTVGTFPTYGIPQMVFLSFVRGSFALFRHECFF